MLMPALRRSIRADLILPSRYVGYKVHCCLYSGGQQAYSERSLSLKRPSTWCSFLGGLQHTLTHSAIHIFLVWSAKCAYDTDNTTTIDDCHHRGIG
jgi:hypothetical protein